MKMEGPGEGSIVTTGLFGHCAFAGSDLDKHNCPATLQRGYHGKAREGRKTVESFIYIDEWRRCSCFCHIPEDERPKPKKVRKRAAPKTKRKSK